VGDGFMKNDLLGKTPKRLIKMTFLIYFAITVIFLGLCFIIKFPVYLQGQLTAFDPAGNSNQYLFTTTIDSPPNKTLHFRSDRAQFAATVVSTAKDDKSGNSVWKIAVVDRLNTDGKSTLVKIRTERSLFYIMFDKFTD
jgi:hypothetical protein